MTEKLEVKDLAPYLPYGLTVINDSYPFTGIGQIHTLCTILETCAVGLSNKQFPIQIIKPILRPISDIIKEIEHEGKKFVPIVRLAKIEVGEHNCEVCTKIEDDGCSYFIDYLPTWFSLYFHKTYYSFSRWDDGEERTACNNDLRQKLIEWHFDIYGLIEKGLAIDKNTIK